MTLLLVFGVVLVLIAYLCMVIALKLIGVRRKWRISLLAVPVVAAAIGGCFFIANRPASAFELVLGFRPTPDVVDLQASNFVANDTGVTFLHFKASKDTVDHILHPDYKPMTATTQPIVTHTAPPAWWAPPAGAVEYRARSSKKYANENKSLFYDAATGDVYFRFVGTNTN